MWRAGITFLSTQTYLLHLGRFAPKSVKRRELPPPSSITIVGTIPWFHHQHYRCSPSLLFLPGGMHEMPPKKDPVATAERTTQSHVSILRHPSPPPQHTQDHCTVKIATSHPNHFGTCSRKKSLMVRRWRFNEFDTKIRPLRISRSLLGIPAITNEEAKLGYSFI